jgi:hypothetical protein
MNSHGALRLSAADGQRTFQIVDYATAELREIVADAVVGETVDVRLVALGSRGDAWRVVAVTPTEHSERPSGKPVTVGD